MGRRGWNWLSAWLLAAGLALLAPGLAGAQGESIERFHSLVRVLPDASLEVTETITVMAQGQDIRRGIVREFPTTYNNRRGLRVKVGFDIVRITRDGQPEPYQEKKALNGVKIYIGDKNSLVPHGRHTYAVTYRTTRQIGYFAGYDELYWNVTGNDWRLPIERAEALILLPPGGQVLQSAAYTGRSGEKGQDFRESRPDNGRIQFVTTSPLPPGQGLTVAVAWPKGLVATRSELEDLLGDNAAAVRGGLGLLLVLAYYLWAWFKVGRDPRHGTIAPLFAPPAGMSPASVRYITRMGYDIKTMAVAVVDMAVKSFLTISQEEDQYTLNRGQAGEGALAPAERKAAAKLFSGQQASLKLTTGQHSKLQAAGSALQQGLATDHDKVHFKKNAGYFAPGLGLSLLALVVMCWGGGDDLVGLTLWVSIWTIGCLVLAVLVWRTWRGVGQGAGSWLKRAGAALFMTMFASVFWGAEFLGLYLHANETGFLTSGMLLAIMAINPLFFYLLKAPTLLGRQLLDQIEGFRLYLSLAEEDRLNILNPPEKTPELFERFLPYAMALDVEQQWGERFQEVLERANQQPGGYSPHWYHGNSWSPSRAGDFAGGLGGGFASTIASSSSSPGSSSGSGGGGSSGGGGGGGGGGGW